MLLIFDDNQEYIASELAMLFPGEFILLDDLLETVYNEGVTYTEVMDFINSSPVYFVSDGKNANGEAVKIVEANEKAFWGMPVLAYDTGILAEFGIRSPL